ncbi:MAG: hypothetical protein GY750_20700 [Lentisphaerae bacterium]|nr:hypothetical protein [Lentisphaerota bacterium]MCP4103811.1 hypothetical protein [Lentisphaerota bacterium]
MASTLKNLSGKLPRGMREYYEFIFTVAENTEKTAKVFYGYVSKLEKEFENIDNELKSGAFSKISERNYLIKRGRGVHRDNVEKVRGH